MAKYDEPYRARVAAIRLARKTGMPVPEPQQPQKTGITPPTVTPLEEIPLSLGPTRKDSGGSSAG